MHSQRCYLQMFEFCLKTGRKIDYWAKEEEGEGSENFYKSLFPIK